MLTLPSTLESFLLLEYHLCIALIFAGYDLHQFFYVSMDQSVSRGFKMNGLKKIYII